MTDWILTKTRKMTILDSIGYLLFVGIFLIFIDYTQQKPGHRYPTYSLQNMPKTDFSCRDKILGGYYADADTQCQMFHICVKIAGVGVQDFRFLCPNGTAFDQEAQTCADFGDVDCEQATLFYGSDNFDLYRIGSGFDTSKRPTPATEDESTFHLQRAESNDVRRSKQPIAVQNALYNLGSSSSSSFNHNQQQQQQQPQQRSQQQPSHQTYDSTALKSANQYQPQKAATPTTTTTFAPPTARSTLLIRKSSAAAQVTVKPTPFVASSSSNSNNNDEIFKGSHSSNFYTNRNSNDDDDDYKRSSITNTVKSRHRSRGRSQYRGTPATSTTTTTTTYKPSSPAAQNYTTFSPFTIKSTTPTPFKFTFASTVRSGSASASNDNQLKSTPLGPLQQQYQQTNYNNNNFINYKVPSTTTSAPIPTTLRSNFRPSSLNLVTTTPTFNAPLRQVVSAPTPFNLNHLNGNNANAKFVNKNAPFTINVNNNNNNVLNNNLFGVNATNVNRQRNFDNQNSINNYQTTSPFSNHRTFENHLTPNNTVLRLTPTLADHISSPNSATNLPRNNQANSITTHHPQLFLSSSSSATTQSPIVRNSVAPVRPNFSQQDLLNQFNGKFTQQKPTPIANNNPSTQRRPDQAQTYRVQLHYDINDYLTTDKYTTQSYSPTSEQYRSVQTYSTPKAPLQQQPSNQFFTTKRYDQVYSTTPKIAKYQFDTNNQQYQTQQDRSPQAAQNSQFKFNSPIINTTPASAPKQLSNLNNFNSNNNIDKLQTSTKKFSTLVPRENYAPTTFKPLFYFNVAKQINDHLSTPAKINTTTESIRFPSSTSSSLPSLTPTSTIRSVPTEPIFNRGPDFSHLNFRESKTNQAPVAQFQPANQFQTVKPVNQQTAKPFNQQTAKPFNQFQQFQPVNQFQLAKTPNVTEIDENDGQYHPELYEKDFARYKLKSRKKQQQQQLGQIQQFQPKQNFNKPQNNVAASSNFQQNVNRGAQKGFTTNSNEEEFLNTAHSQNIAASGNELWAHSKNAAAAAASAIKAKQQFNEAAKALNIQSSTSKKPITSAATSKDDKDVSYDYAYYDSANDTPHDYSEFDLDFTKTRKQ